MFIACVDAGGTKTRYELRDRAGTVLAAREGTTVHPAQVGLERSVATLHDVLAQMAADKGADLADTVVALGLAGYGPGRREAMDEALGAAFADAADLRVESDAEVARLGALGGADGILVVAGTGSIAVGSFDGEKVRAGGWGWSLGDEGSGAWIGREAIRHGLRQVDGRESATTLLVGVLRDGLGVADLRAAVDRINRAEDPRRLCASLVPAIAEAARAGDQRALSLFQQAAQELASLATAAGADHPGAPVSWTGGLFSLEDLIVRPFRGLLSGDLAPVAPQGTPLDGAFILATAPDTTAPDLTRTDS